MPWRPRAACLVVGCQTPSVRQGRCLAHAQQLERTRESATARGYTQKEWRRKRHDKLQREPVCRTCKTLGRTTFANEVDHIVPKSLGGTDDDDNLQPLCKACHSRKTAQEIGLGREGELSV